MFISFGLCLVFVGAHRLSLVAVHKPLTVGASRCRAQALGCLGSEVAVPGLYSIGSTVEMQLLHGKWDPPRSGGEPGSPASAGGLFTGATRETLELLSTCQVGWCLTHEPLNKANLILEWTRLTSVFERSQVIFSPNSGASSAAIIPSLSCMPA